MRYIIRIYGNSLTHLDRAFDFDDASQAASAAIVSAREYMVRYLRMAGGLLGDWQIEIIDEGEEVADLIPMHRIIGAPNPADRFRSLYLSAPHPYLLLSPRLTILDANPAYQQATMTDAQLLGGQHMFLAFPDNPNDPHANGVFKLARSFEQVVEAKERDEMATQRYDIRARDGTWCKRYWKPVNFPLLGEGGEILFIVHSVEDVTPPPRAKAA
jgi:PAS domain-containing protein